MDTATQELETTAAHDLAEDLRSGGTTYLHRIPDLNCEDVTPWLSVFYVSGPDGQRFRVKVEDIA